MHRNRMPRNGRRFLAAVMLAAVTFTAANALASSHREAPAISQYPAPDNTDTYLDLGAIRAIPGDMGEGVDALAGFNCQSIVMELAIAEITRDSSNPVDPSSAAAVIGLWSTSVAPRASYGATPAPLPWPRACTTTASPPRPASWTRSSP